MATGSDHYSLAERLLIDAAKVVRRNDDACPEADRMIAEAQVHATLALAAATAKLGPVAASGYDDADLDAWHEVAGTKPVRVIEDGDS